MALFNITEQHSTQFFSNHLFKLNEEGSLITDDKPRRRLLGKIIHYISRPNERIAVIRDTLIRKTAEVSRNEQLSISELTCCYLNLSAFRERIIQKHNAHSRFRVTDVEEQTFTDLMLQVRTKTEAALHIEQETPFDELIERYLLDVTIVKTTCTFLSLLEPEEEHLIRYKREIKARYQSLMDKAIEVIEDLAEKAQEGIPFTEEDERKHNLMTDLLERRPLSLLNPIFFHDDDQLLDIKRTSDIFNEKIGRFAGTLQGYFTDIKQLFRKLEPAREVGPFSVRETVNYHLQLRIASPYFDHISNLILPLNQLDFSKPSFPLSLQCIRDEMARLELEIRQLNLDINAPFHPALMSYVERVASTIRSVPDLKEPFDELKRIQALGKKAVWGSISITELRQKLNGYTTSLNKIPHIKTVKSQFWILYDELDSNIREITIWCEERLRFLLDKQLPSTDFDALDIEQLSQTQSYGINLLPIEYREDIKRLHAPLMEAHFLIKNLHRFEEVMENSLLYGTPFETNLQINLGAIISGPKASVYQEKLELLQRKKEILLEGINIVNRQDERILTRNDQVTDAVRALRNISYYLQLLNSYGHTRSVFIDKILLRKLKHIETIYGHRAVNSVNERINSLEKILVLIKELTLENISQQILKILKLQTDFSDLLKYAYLIIPNRDVDSLSEFLNIIKISSKTFEACLRVWKNDAPPEHEEEISLLKIFPCNLFCPDKLRDQLFLLKKMFILNFHPLQVCPISSKSLTKPVKVMNGDHYYYYDKKALEKWKQACRGSGKPFTDPYTRIPLQDNMIQDAPEVADIIKIYYELRGMKPGDEDS